MTLDLQTAKQNLAKAKDDVTFWDNAVRLLSDPRIAAIPDTTFNPFARVKTAPITARDLFPQTYAVLPRPYGELKRKVLEALPPYGTQGVTTTEIVERMAKQGYVFSSKTPGVSVNEALNTLAEKVCHAGSRGSAKLWTKAEDKSQTAPEGAV